MGTQALSSLSLGAVARVRLRARRREASRGAVFVEAMAVISMLAVMLGCIIFIHAYSLLRLRTQSAARIYAMANAQTGCETPVATTSVFPDTDSTTGKNRDLGDIVIGPPNSRKLNDMVQKKRLDSNTDGKIATRDGQVKDRAYVGGEDSADANNAFDGMKDDSDNNGAMIPSSTTTTAMAEMTTGGAPVRTKSSSYVLCNDPKLIEGNVKNMVKKVMGFFMKSLFNKIAGG